MPNKEELTALAEAFYRPVRAHGEHALLTNTSMVHVRVSGYTRDYARQHWRNPSLFIPRAALECDIRSKVTIYYIMKCGVILSIDLPTIVPNGPKLPTYITEYEDYPTFAGEYGYYIPFRYWIECGNVNDYQQKQGSTGIYYTKPTKDAVELLTTD